MPKGNTLLNYFTKSPSISRSINSSSNTLTTKNENKEDSSFKIGDLVWAKLEGYPWWPSIICKDPDEEVHKKSQPYPQIHVQFFDEPPSRSWIRTKFTKGFTGSQDETIPSCRDKKWKNACERADKALELNTEDRLMLITNFSQSEEELNDDDDIDDMSEKSSDNLHSSKENEVKEELNCVKMKKDSIDHNSSFSNNIKRRRIVVVSDSDSSDCEYKPDAKDKSSEYSEEENLSEISSTEETPQKKKRKRPISPLSSDKGTKRCKLLFSNTVTSTPKSKSVELDMNTKKKLSSFSMNDSVNSTTSEVDGNQQWRHLKLDFLREENIKDIEGRPCSHPEYDPTTLYVPESFKKTLTPAVRQWWEMKSRHYDVVLFFKVGKFYELYHMDAVIGVTELGLIYMKGDFAHSGFPEIAYSRFADTLVQKGYKVARVEQTETPAMMEDRCKKMAHPTKFDRVVNREICRITSKGTKMSSFIDGDVKEIQSNYLLSFTEKIDASGIKSHYGVCFVDASTGKFYIGQFSDDRHGSRFRTMISHYTPSQVIYEKGSLSPNTSIILTNLSSVLKESLNTKLEFWDACKTLKWLAEGGYFLLNNELVWPETIQMMLDENDSLGLTPKDTYTLAVKALGACIWYLHKCKVEQELLSMRNFEEYKPIDEMNLQIEKRNKLISYHMVLDSVSLSNLDVVQNNSTGTLEGSLLEQMDHCYTAFGKRLFRHWLCFPLCNPKGINDRLDAVEDLMNHKDILTDAKELFKTIPDLERLLCRIHSQGINRNIISHPDSRAIFYEDEAYGKRKIEAFLSALSGFKSAQEIMNIFMPYCNEFKSELLKHCVMLEEKGGSFPNLNPLLDYFDEAFDHEKAKKEGRIIPSKGVDEEYDNAFEVIKETNKELKEYLDQQCRKFGCKVTYFGTGKNRFQLEIPDHVAKNASEKYELQSQKKGYKRYWTNHIKELLSQLISAEEQRDAALKDIMRRIFASFDKNYEKWECAVNCMAKLDCLISLAEFSSTGDGVLSRPEVLTVDYEPFIEILNGHHPCFKKKYSGDDFIPNDTIIGIPVVKDKENASNENSPKLILITGPNMGGKSTLMRQVGLIVIIAQLGCYVPAEKCRLSSVDRIFTRLGASDRIMAGESTFFVELSETSAILHHATKHSLVLMDELGRGTATYDGTAIACAVVKELAERIQCRTLFSTHYHSLVEEFALNPNISLGHMSCMVEDENEDDPTLETITFLYKFSPGACPKSYGFNAAKLASIPVNVIRNGYKKARQLEETIQQLQTFRKVMKSKHNEASVLRLFHRYLDN